MQLFLSSRNRSARMSSMHNRRSPWRTFRPRLELLEDRTLLSPYMVTTTADGGAGSLRDAINQTNADTGHAVYASPSNPNTDEIDFNIGGGGVQTIAPTSALPTITNAVLLDGTTQPGYNGTPIIALSGSAAGAGVDGLDITASGSTVRGLVVNGFGGNGIVITGSGATGNVVEGNYIGTDMTGTVALGNDLSGVNIEAGASNNTIGGNTAGARNIISGNRGDGVTITGSGTTGNIVVGNYIGTNTVFTYDPAADFSLSGNPNGVWRYGWSDTLTGALTLYTNHFQDGARNIWNDPNHQVFGVPTVYKNTGGEYVSANVDLPSGTLALHGGGPESNGNLTENDYSHVIFTAPQAGEYRLDCLFQVRQFYPGGNANVQVLENGVTVFSINLPSYLSSASYNGVFSLAAGDTLDFADGFPTIPINGGNTVQLQASIATTSTSPQPSALSTAKLGNMTNGVAITSGASDNTIGGTTAAARNIISGNTGDGIEITGTGSTGNVVEGNYIGTDITGNTAIPNGTVLDATFNDGVVIDGGASNNLVGGTVAGAGNVISGNADTGISILGPSANNKIQGNLIGTNATGTRALTNHEQGILIADDAGRPTGTVIGGDDAADGSADGIVQARNVVVGPRAIRFYSGGTGTVIEGNYLNTDITGSVLLNTGDSVFIQDTAFVTVGGTTAGAGNLLGSDLELSSGADLVVQGNTIGLDATGLHRIAQGRLQINADLTTVNDGMSATIGGATPRARNVIAGPIGIGNSGAYPHGSVFVEGNYIGTDVTGTVAFSNPADDGIYVNASDVTIGGTTPGAGNVIAGFQTGIDLRGYAPSGVFPTRNTIEGNFIGTDATGTVPLGNGTGILIRDGAHANTIGGTSAAAGNTISGNTGTGVVVDGTSTVANALRQNLIYNNGGSPQAIALTNGGNANQPAPVLTQVYSGGATTGAIGTLTAAPSTSYALEFFDGSAAGQASSFLGSATVTTNASGVATFNIVLNVSTPVGSFAAATATDPNGNTSQLSVAVQVVNVATTTLLTSSANPSLLNQSITLTATVSPAVASVGTPTGSVDFYDTTTNTDLGIVTLASGTAQITTSSLAVGNHVIQARYSGDSIFLPSTGSITQSVQYAFSGYLAPLNKNLAFAVGRSVPIKFQLTDANGAFISSLSAVTSLQVESVDSAGNPLGPPFTPASNTGLTYDTTANQYVFNWKTAGLAAGTYEILLTLADGTVQTKVLTLRAPGSAGAQVADGSTATSTAGALLGGDIELYVDNSSGLFTSDELARINDAVAAVDATLAPYGVTITEVTDSSVANVTLDTGSTSAVGGYVDGVLGCWNTAGEITLIQGWNWYAGSDPTQIGAGQYDFQTTVTHELGHALGLGESSDPTSAMYASLATGTVIRNLTTADLAIPYTGTGADAVHAAPGGANAPPLSPPGLPPGGATGAVGIFVALPAVGPAARLGTGGAAALGQRPGLALATISPLDAAAVLANACVGQYLAGALQSGGGDADDTQVTDVDGSWLPDDTIPAAESGAWQVLEKAGNASRAPAPRVAVGAIDALFAAGEGTGPLPMRTAEEDIASTRAPAAVDGTWARAEAVALLLSAELTDRRTGRRARTFSLFYPLYVGAVGSGRTPSK